MFETVEDVQRARSSEQGYICDAQHRDGGVPGAASSRSRCSSRAPPASARPSSPRWSRRRPAGTLIRLQCYEGLDEAKALYEWEYSKQLLYTQILKEKIREVMAGTKTLREAAERVGQQDNVFFSEQLHRAAPAAPRDHVGGADGCC